jgi:hypothetical protein
LGFEETEAASKRSMETAQMRSVSWESMPQAPRPVP